MKITFCTFDDDRGVAGPNSWALRLLPELRRRGVDARVLVLTTCFGGKTITALRGMGFVCHETSLYDDTETNARWILRHLAKDPPDVFVPNCLVSAYFAAAHARAAGIPTVGVLHSDDAFHDGLVEEFVTGAPENRVSALVCCSQFLADKTASVLPPDSAVVVRRIPYGVPVPAEVAAPPAERLRLCYVGRLAEEQKRISDVVRALCRAVRDVPNTEAVLFGDGPDRAAAERVLAAEGRGLPVSLAGAVPSEDVQARLLTQHVLVLLSDYEGLPIAVMEAMACGVVPICSRMESGIPELVQDGETGLLVSDRAEEFVNAVRRLRDEPGLWARLSAGARGRIEQGYALDVCAGQWHELLQTLAGSAAVRRPLVLPRRIILPPVNPKLGREDARGGFLPVRAYKRARRFVRTLTRPGR